MYIQEIAGLEPELSSETFSVIGAGRDFSNYLNYDCRFPDGGRNVRTRFILNGLKNPH
jgi:hypothetical protein